MPPFEPETTVWSVSRREVARAERPVTMSANEPCECVLAADVGTTGLKCTLVTREGTVLAAKYRDYEHGTDVSRDGTFVEQQPGDWWCAFCTCLGLLRDELSPEALSAVAAVVLSGQMQDLILLDKDKRPLRPAILYSDSRAVDEARRVEGFHSPEELHAMTGNWKGPVSVLPKLM